MGSEEHRLQSATFASKLDGMPFEICFVLSQLPITCMPLLDSLSAGSFYVLYKCLISMQQIQ